MTLYIGLQEDDSAKLPGSLDSLSNLGLGMGLGLDLTLDSAFSAVHPYSKDGDNAIPTEGNSLQSIRAKHQSKFDSLSKDDTVGNGGQMEAHYRRLQCSAGRISAMLDTQDGFRVEEEHTAGKSRGVRTPLPQVLNSVVVRAHQLGAGAGAGAADESGYGAGGAGGHEWEW